MTYNQLTSEQRYTISILLQQGMKQKYIAKAIKVSPSTISRELKRNSGKQGHYNYKTAQFNANYRKHRKPDNRSKAQIMERAIGLLVTEQWSPQQISGSLALENVFISHETIYKYIRRDKDKGGKLYKNCRHHLKHRKRAITGKCIPIPNRTSISERPQEANGERCGDFEMDTIIGKDGRGDIVTLIERSTNMLFMRKLDKGKNAKELAQTVVKMLMPYKEYIKTVTTDNGTEFACHEIIAKGLETKVYFADPYASWQKGAIENVNGLIRQYIPKGTDFKEYSHQKITKIMHKINMRPRKKLKFASPTQCFYGKIA